MYFTRTDETVVNTQLIETSVGALTALYTPQHVLIDVESAALVAGYSASTALNEDSFRDVTAPIYEVKQEVEGEDGKSVIKRKGFTLEAWSQWLNQPVRRRRIQEGKRALRNELDSVLAHANTRPEIPVSVEPVEAKPPMPAPVETSPVAEPQVASADLVVLSSFHGKSCAVTTSLKVAEVFGKNHCDVLRAIENMLGDLSKKGQRNFASTFCSDSFGRQQPMYEMTRDGFMLLAMGFTGAKAMQFKEAFIEAFNLMEEQLATRTPQDYISALKALIVQEEEKQRLQAQNDMLKIDNRALEHRAEKAELEVVKLEVERAEDEKYTNFGKVYESECDIVPFAVHYNAIRNLQKDVLALFRRKRFFAHLSGQRDDFISKFPWYGHWIRYVHTYDGRTIHKGYRLTTEGQRTGWLEEHESRVTTINGSTVVTHSAVLTGRAHIELGNLMLDWLEARGFRSKTTNKALRLQIIMEGLRNARNSEGDLTDLTED